MNYIRVEMDEEIVKDVTDIIVVLQQLPPESKLVNILFEPFKDLMVMVISSDDFIHTAPGEHIPTVTVKRDCGNNDYILEGIEKCYKPKEVNKAPNIVKVLVSYGMLVLMKNDVVVDKIKSLLPGATFLNMIGHINTAAVDFIFDIGDSGYYIPSSTCQLKRDSDYNYYFEPIIDDSQPDDSQPTPCYMNQDNLYVDKNEIGLLKLSDGSVKPVFKNCDIELSQTKLRYYVTDGKDELHELDDNCYQMMLGNLNFVGSKQFMEETAKQRGKMPLYRKFFDTYTVEPGTCSHKWENYVGFTDTYKFCSLCNEKEA